MACLASEVYVLSSPSCDIDILSGSSGTSVEWMGLQSFINVDFLCKSIVMSPGVYVEIWECVQGNWQTFRIKVQVWNLYVESPYDLYSNINFCLFLHSHLISLKLILMFFFKWEIVREYLVHTAYCITSHLVSSYTFNIQYIKCRKWWDNINHSMELGRNVVKRYLSDKEIWGQRQTFPRGSSH